MKQRRWWLVAILVALALVAAGCGDDDDAADVGADDTEVPTDDGDGDGDTIEYAEGTTMARIRDEGTIVVGTKFDQPLFGLKSATSGEVEGFDVEIAKLIAEQIDPDLEVEFVEAVSKNREPFIQDGRVDMVVATYTINDTRKQVVDFAGPYYIAGQDIMVAAGNEDIQSVEDLNGRKVCTVQGSTSLTNVQAAAPEADLSITFDTYSQCAEALTDNRVEAVTTDDIILLGLIAESDGAYELVGETFTEEPYGVGLAKGDDEFRSFINDVLELIYENGEWEAAFDRTVGQAGIEAPEPPPVDRY